jgi:serine/threonine protein phosphatase PrpC
VTWDAKGNITTCERVNRELHHADNLSEVARVAKKNGIPPEATGRYDRNKVLPFGRLGSVLEMTRAIGDNRLEGSGLSHDPDIFHQSIEIPENGRAILIVASDGLVESWSREVGEAPLAEANKLKSILEASPDLFSKSLQEISYYLSKSACESGSTDNITVLTTELGGKTHPRYLFVADGHNGAAVSQEISKQFQPALLGAFAKLNLSLSLK